MVRRISGRVMRAEALPAALAPSMRAASCRSGGIACRPVSRMIMVKPAIFQTTMTMIDQKAVSNVGEQVDRPVGQAERRRRPG